ncbi:hypothetical protein HN446_03205 [bacterium]|jgi:hypothetical protein|nr:hypothetical protein [bacterium]
MKKLILCILLSGLFGTSTVNFSADVSSTKDDYVTALEGHVTSLSEIVTTQSRVRAIEGQIRFLEESFYCFVYTLGASFLSPSNRWAIVLSVLKALHSLSCVSSEIKLASRKDLILGGFLLLAGFSAGRISRFMVKEFFPDFDRSLLNRYRAMYCTKFGPRGALVIPAGVEVEVEQGAYAMLQAGSRLGPQRIVVGPHFFAAQAVNFLPQVVVVGPAAPAPLLVPAPPPVVVPPVGPAQEADLLPPYNSDSDDEDGGE